MRKLKFYIETSVWNFLLLEEHYPRRLTTIKFFEYIKNKHYKIFISPLVVIEIERTPDSIRRAKLINSIENYKPEVLTEIEEVILLAEKYLSQKIIPEKYRNDAIHIAYTTFYELDAIISWNLKHIVKMRTRQLVNYTNIAEGYKLIEIVTPEEVIEYE